MMKQEVWKKLKQVPKPLINVNLTGELGEGREY